MKVRLDQSKEIIASKKKEIEKVERGIADLKIKLDSKEQRNKFIEISGRDENVRKADSNSKIAKLNVLLYTMERSAGWELHIKFRELF